MAKAKEQGKKTNGRSLGLVVGKEAVAAAIAVLNEYVAERVAICEKEKLGDLKTAVELMDALDGFKDMVGEMIKSPAEKAYNTLKFTIVPMFMDDEDVRSITYEGIGRINAIDDISTKILDKEGLKKWLESQDLGDLVTETVNAQTLAAALRARIKDGKTMPPENVVKVTPVVRAQITR